MKINLDDLREAPAGWIRMTHPKEVISYIRKGEAEIIDLDYHLGKGKEYTGLTVLEWLQKEIGEGKTVIQVPEIRIHTSDLQAKEIMEGIRRRIYKWIKRDIGE